MILIIVHPFYYSSWQILFYMLFEFSFCPSLPIGGSFYGWKTLEIAMNLSTECIAQILNFLSTETSVLNYKLESWMQKRKFQITNSNSNE